MLEFFHKFMHDSETFIETVVLVILLPALIVGTAYFMYYLTNGDD